MSDESLIKNAAAIVTCDTDDTIWRDCDLLVNGAEIQEIGPNLSPRIRQCFFNVCPMLTQ